MQCGPSAAVEEGVARRRRDAALLYATRVLEHKKGANHDQQGRHRDRAPRVLQAPSPPDRRECRLRWSRWSPRPECSTQKDVNFGFDAQKGEYVNMIKAVRSSIRLRSSRTALQGAVSVAVTIWTTEGHGGRLVAGQDMPIPAMPGGWPMGWQHGTISPARSRHPGVEKTSPLHDDNGTGGVYRPCVPEYSLVQLRSTTRFSSPPSARKKSGLPLTVLTASFDAAGLRPVAGSRPIVGSAPKETARSSILACDDCHASRGRLEGRSDSEGDRPLVWCNWLPGRSAALVIPSVACRTRRKRKDEVGCLRRGWRGACFAVALLFRGLHLLDDNNLEVGRGAGRCRTQQ